MIDYSAETTDNKYYGGGIKIESLRYPAGHNLLESL